MTLRKLRLTRNDPSRDPMLRGVWVGGFDSLPSPPSATTSPTPPEPFQLLPEAPMPPIDPDTERRWTNLLNMTDEVIKALGLAADIDHQVLVAVVRDVAENSLSVDDIAAIYRHRINEQKP